MFYLIYNCFLFKCQKHNLKMVKINYNKQYIDLLDKKRFLKSLNSDLITTGPYISKLEKRLSKYLKVKEVVTCSSERVLYILPCDHLRFQKVMLL